MKIIGIIPARWGATRFEGKVLADINGKPMIQRVWEQAKKSQSLDEVLVACDDERIYKAAEEFGAKAIMTSKDHASGTDRIAEAVTSLAVDIVVNIQGDEPLIQPSVIDDLANALSADEECQMATVVKVIDDEQELNDPNVVKVVIDQKGYALYFSRSTVPFIRDNKKSGDLNFYKHLGLYAYKKKFLLGYKDLPASQLELSEKLEQLRALEAGYRIKTVITKEDTVSVDTPEDLERVKQLIK